MTDFYEIDFWDVESDKSGDAISMRYSIGGKIYVHVVDGGYQSTGESLVQNVQKYYGGVKKIDHVVATHNDGDHAGGLRPILENFEIGTLWLLRPWEYAEELLDRFENYESAEYLRRKLRSLYPNLAALEDIANENGIEIREPFQGQMIGTFCVLAPTKARFLDLVVASEKTPEIAADDPMAKKVGLAGFFEAAKKAAKEFVNALWGDEVFSSKETSAENDMSVVQFANLAGDRILLTGDVGRGGLTEAADFAPFAGLTLPGIDKFQVPHHGSRRNVSSEVLDKWLGPKVPENQAGTKFEAYISSAKADEHHPRKAVVRAVHHRGGKVYATEGRSIRTNRNAPTREGWNTVAPMEYPAEQEHD
jgi:beta-lactamase superfamily II metal-dependent hydrolase